MGCDCEYRKDYDYLKDMKKFSNKDTLTMALYSEWVKRRYTKPTESRNYGVSIAAILMAYIAFVASIIDSSSEVEKIILFISGILFLFAIILAFFKQRKDEKDEITKLNAIREAIEELSKENN